MAMCSNLLARKSPWTEEPGLLQSAKGSRRDPTEHAHRGKGGILSSPKAAAGDAYSCPCCVVTRALRKALQKRVIELDCDGPDRRTKGGAVSLILQDLPQKLLSFTNPNSQLLYLCVSLPHES